MVVPVVLVVPVVPVVPVVLVIPVVPVVCETLYRICDHSRRIPLTSPHLITEGDLIQEGTICFLTRSHFHYT